MRESLSVNLGSLEPSGSASLHVHVYVLGGRRVDSRRDETAGSPLGEVSHVARASWLILTILAGDPEVGAFVGSYAPLKLWHWYEMLTECNLP